jgi:hypothetical protein
MTIILVYTIEIYIFTYLLFCACRSHMLIIIINKSVIYNFCIVICLNNMDSKKDWRYGKKPNPYYLKGKKKKY